MADPTIVDRIAKAAGLGGDLPGSWFDAYDEIGAALDAGLTEGLISNALSQGGTTALDTLVKNYTLVKSETTQPIPGYRWEIVDGVSQQVPTGSVSAGTPTSTTPTESAPTLSGMYQWLIDRGIVTREAIQSDVYDYAYLSDLAKDAGYFKQFTSTGGTGTSGGGGVTGPSELANAEGQSILNNFNPATDLILLPDGRSLIRGTTTVIDTRQGGALAPVSGIPDLFYDPISKQFVDRSGVKLDANRLIEDIRSNKANEALQSGQLAETVRSNQVGEALQGQEVTNRAVSNIAQLGANPANWVEREYTIRGLQSPSPTGSNRFDTTGALAKLYGVGATGAPAGTGTGGTPLANATLASGGYPTLAQTLANPESNPNWLQPSPVVNPATGTDPRLGATGTTRTPEEAQSLASLMAAEWTATHPFESTLPEAQLGAAGIPGNTGVWNYDPQAGWLLTKYGDTTPTTKEETYPQTYAGGVDNTPEDATQTAVSPTGEQVTWNPTDPSLSNIFDYNEAIQQQAAPVDDTTLQEPAPGTNGFDAGGGYTDEWGNYSPAFAYGTDPNLTGRGTTLADTFIAGDPQADGGPNPEKVNVIDPPGPNNAEASVTPLRDMMGGGQMPQQQGNGGLAKLMAGILVEISNQWGQSGGMAQYAYGTANRPQVTPSLPSQATRPMPTQSRAGMDNRNRTPVRPTLPAQASNRVTPVRPDMPMQAGNRFTPTRPTMPPQSRSGNQVRAYAYGTDTTTSGNVFGQNLTDNYGFAPQPDANIQQLPSLRALYSGDLGWYNAPRESSVQGPFGTTLPGSGSINVANYNEVAKDPTSLGMLQSLYRGASRDLTSEVARARRFAPVGQGLRSLSTVRT